MACLPQRTAAGLMLDAADDGDELSHAPRDALVDSVEYFAFRNHVIPDRPRIHRGRVEVTENHHIARHSPEALTDQAALSGIHDQNEIGGADHGGGYETRPVRREVDAVALRRRHRFGWRRAIESDEARGLHGDAERRELPPEQRGGKRTAANVPVTHHQQVFGARSRTQDLERLPPAQRMQPPFGGATYAQQ